MAEDFIEEYLVDKDISKFRGKITQYDLGPMDAQRVDSRNPGTNDPEPGSGGSTGTPPTQDGNVVCEKQYAGSGGEPTGNGGYNAEVCDYYLVTVYDRTTDGSKHVWYTYISEENCRIVWIAQQAAAGTTACPSGTGDGEIPVIEPCLTLRLGNTSFNTCDADFETNLLSWLEENGGIDPETQEYDNLNECEQAAVKRYPFKAMTANENSAVAHYKTQELFGSYNPNTGNGHNDCADAFRHAFFNAINARDIGVNVTKTFGDAHECDTPINLAIEKEMDLFNNEIGRLIGSQNPDANDDEMALLVMQQFGYGQLRYLYPLGSQNQVLPNSNLIPSFNGCQ